MRQDSFPSSDVSDVSFVSKRSSDRFIVRWRLALSCTRSLLTRELPLPQALPSSPPLPSRSRPLPSPDPTPPPSALPPLPPARASTEPHALLCTAHPCLGPHAIPLPLPSPHTHQLPQSSPPANAPPRQRSPHHSQADRRRLLTTRSRIRGVTSPPLSQSALSARHDARGASLHAAEAGDASGAAVRE